MPFVEINRAPIRHSICEPSQIPIFLFPGILGNGVELQELANQLAKRSNGQRSIYVYHDERAISDPASFSLSLSDQTNRIVQEMGKLQAPGPVPYLVGGYSFGCILATQVGIKLKQAGQGVHLFPIDGVTVDLARSHFCGDGATSDFLKIINYVGKLVKINPIEINQAELKSISLLGWQEQLDYLFNKLLQNNQNVEESSLSQAMKLFHIAKENIQAIIHSPETNHSPDQEIDTINALVTQQTEKQYEKIRQEWKQLAKPQQTAFITNSDLLMADHMDLLSKKHARVLAKLIHQAVETVIPRQVLLEKQISHLLQHAVSDADEPYPLKHESFHSSFNPFESEDESLTRRVDTTPDAPTNTPASGWSTDHDTDSDLSSKSDLETESTSPQPSPPPSPKKISRTNGVTSSLFNLFPFTSKRPAGETPATRQKSEENRECADKQRQRTITVRA